MNLPELSKDDLNRIREWFDCVQDTNPKYLQPADYALAANVYRMIGMRVPHRVLEGAGLPIPSEPESKFETVAEGSGYRHSKGDHGSATLLGVKCPKCSHVFMPQPLVSDTITCPQCGHSESV